ncbi:conserved hypothetical protein (plasmid) [Rippkaea orientalis PCC 8801]|uniref:Uncharacterized protein n=1 Tax=Rippkaea orientalis (strain PCC 8801 / RF-1) TaxID=41431 RepID=B7K6J4_RIPO1|nr:hypothetical protein [Rippkaea orientalis]ACK68416.1 conserved hypothetical protein [Rippkaea orientalis PCC 8801]
MKLEPLKAFWRKRLVKELPYYDGKMTQSILCWLFTDQGDKTLVCDELAFNERLHYRYRILQQRYLDRDSHQAYSRLIIRLAAVLLGIPSIQVWLKQRSKSQKQLLKLIQILVQELLDNDSNLQQRIKPICEYTSNFHLHQALMLATVEEYCLEKVNNQPLLIHRFRQYLESQLHREIEKVA